MAPQRTSLLSRHAVPAPSTDEALVLFRSLIHDQIVIGTIFFDLVKGFLPDQQWQVMVIRIDHIFKIVKISIDGITLAIIGCPQPHVLR
jgi:hypothetical protein